jgi:hypothetical protein
MALGWYDAVGTAGTLVVVAAYFLTQVRLVNSSDLAFPVANLGGSLLISFSLYYNFNLASALMEIFWIAISLLGIGQWLRARRRTARARSQWLTPR